MKSEAVSPELELNGITKSDLITRLATRYPQLVVKDTELAVKTILDAMTTSLSQGQRIEIRGFGSFGLNYRPPRIGRNPKSGDKVQVPEKHVPHFKAGKELRDRVDAGLPGSTSLQSQASAGARYAGAAVAGAGARVMAPPALAGN